MKPLKYIFILLMMTWACAVHAQMVLEYNIAIPNTQIALPLSGTVNVNIDWGDGAAQETVITAGDKPHTFVTTGIKTVTITGTLTAYGSSSNGDGNARLTKVLSWEGLGLTSLNNAFNWASLLVQVPTSLPSTVTQTASMFYYATIFNQPIGSWNTAAITRMDKMFEGAWAFNQPIGSWNTAAVTKMDIMFKDAGFFNQPIGSWNTAKVTDMSNMFFNASAFNQPIGAWNTALVNNMSYMFAGARAFNQPIGSWNITAVGWMNNMFISTSLCTDNYDNLLKGWASQEVKTGVTFDGGDSKYSSAGVAERTTLKSKGWTIYDAGLGTTAGAKCKATGILEGGFTNLSVAMLYPNPVKDKLLIHFAAPSNEALTYTVFNTTGLLVLEKKVQTNGLDAELELNNLPQGVYVLKIKTINSTIAYSFVKE